MSRVYCSVFGCNSMRKRNPDISFHTFPRKGKEKVYISNKFNIRELVDRHAVWVMKLKIGKPVSKCMKVCSRHFKKDDYFYRTAGSTARQFLKKTAVPTLHLPSVCHGERVKTLTTASKTLRDERAENRAKVKRLLTHPPPNASLERAEVEETPHAQHEFDAAEGLVALLSVQPATIKEEILDLDEVVTFESKSDHDIIIEEPYKNELHDVGLIKIEECNLQELMKEEREDVYYIKEEWKEIKSDENLETSEDYFCYDCDFKCFKKLRLLNHITQNHSNGKSINFTKCEMLLISAMHDKNALRKRTLHPTDEKPFRCIEC